jgi:hypothetical protein
MMRFLKNNGLSLAFFVLFLLCIIGQWATGYALQMEDAAGQSHSSGRFAYLLDPSFLKGVFGNWQAALLQLLALILLTVFLRQKGASHSRKPDDGSEDRGEARLHWFGPSLSWAYGNSLSLAFAGLFLLSFVGFFFAEANAYNAARQRVGEAPLTLGAFLFSADLWFMIFQTWQAEFFAMAMFLVLSVFLRQEGSAESKPVGAGDDETGKTNE